MPRGRFHIYTFLVPGRVPGSGVLGMNLAKTGASWANTSTSLT